jgi:signal transduction histidine kinase
MSDLEGFSSLARRLGLEEREAPSILVVDDEPENLEILQALLSPCGTVRAAGSAAEALAWAEREAVDVVVTDQRMPGMTGVELLEQLRQRFPDLQGVLTTAWADVSTLQRAINRAGVFRVLCKPYDADELLGVVEQAQQHLRAVRLNRELLTLLSSRSESLGRALHELREAQQKLVHLDRLSTIGRLTAGITHDLRNVMQAMVLLDEHLGPSDVPPLVAECVRVGVSGMRSFLDSLRTVHQFGGGGLSLAESEVCVEQLLHDVQVMVTLDPVHRARSLHIALAPSLPRLRGDRPKLVQVLMNLVRNAMQATGDGGAVHVDAAPARGGVTISVVDDGPGVAPAIAARLFEPFASTKGDVGVGMGLYMARIVAASHGGTLEHVPSVEQGARFELWLPSP